MKKTLESVQEENELKSKEYHEASMSLRELQMELMRKSMHVGSLGNKMLLSTMILTEISLSQHGTYLSLILQLLL